jgi:hypothetical protein
VLNAYLTMLFPLGLGETPLAGVGPDLPADPAPEPTRPAAMARRMAGWYQAPAGCTGHLAARWDSRPCPP